MSNLLKGDTNPTFIIGLCDTDTSDQQLSKKNIQFVGYHRFNVFYHTQGMKT